MGKRAVECLSILTLLAAASGGCSSAQSQTAAGFNFGAIDKIAVIKVDTVIGSKAADEQIANFFNMELMSKGYTVIERSQIAAVLAEQKFQAGDVTTSEGAAQAGRILNVPAVMLVSVPSWGEKIEMTAKIVKVEDGSILWIGSGSGGTHKTLGTVLGAAIGAGAGAAVAGGDRGDRVTGAVVGGVVGGAAGYALSPQESKAAQNLIKKVCQTLPARVSSI
jgi:hypothetical protein